MKKIILAIVCATVAASAIVTAVILKKANTSDCTKENVEVLADDEYGLNKNQWIRFPTSSGYNCSKGGNETC